MGEEPGPKQHTQLQPLVQEQCRFFDGLADLIDPKYFYSNDNDTVNLRFMKHSQRAATKSAFKEQKKKNKRAKLDPDAAKTTTELQQAKHKAKGAAGNDGSGDDSGDDEDGTAAAPGPGSRQQAAAAANGGSAGPNRGMLGQLNISAGEHNTFGIPIPLAEHHAASTALVPWHDALACMRMKSMWSM